MARLDGGFNYPIRYSDVLTGKRSPSHPVSYEEAVRRISWDYVKAAIGMDMQWIQDCLYGLSHMYHVDKGKVERDICKDAERHLSKLQHQMNVDMSKLAKKYPHLMVVPDIK